ncbi:MAG: N-acyl homoserine lactonase family protein [Clostridiales Family XIII bacterium]|jgi:glyoxylase-like metal-dependent hydrolase (beta-lactamase superfamily II)|nr:N-acyl homoserine lactonase family protein [Clostridiales Family XIII bacterium]
MADLKVYVMDNGTNVGSIKNDLISTDDPDERFNFPSWTVLIRHKDGNILFDAAAHLDPERQISLILDNLRMEDEDAPVNRLKQIGLEAGDVDTILLSHMHPDHFGYIDAFPNAKIIVHEDEFTYMMRDYALKRFPFTKDFDHFLKQDLKWELFPADVKMRELVPGVTIVNFGEGHSFGVLGLLLELKCGNKLLISDIIYSPENVGPPVRYPGICHDRERWEEVMNYTLLLARLTSAEIWFGHDQAQFDSLIKSTEGYYE